MRVFFRNLVLFVAVWMLAACHGSSKSSGGKTLTLDATSAWRDNAVPNGVKANGTNVVTINVSGATKAPITLKSYSWHLCRRHRGRRHHQITIDGLSGSADLTTCNASTDDTCAGNVRVSAVDADSAGGSVTLTFVGYETICNDGKDNNDDGNSRLRRPGLRPKSLCPQRYGGNVPESGMCFTGLHPDKPHRDLHQRH